MDKTIRNSNTRPHTRRASPLRLAVSSFVAALAAVACESALGTLLPGASLRDSWLLYLAAFLPSWLALWLFAFIAQFATFGIKSHLRVLVQILTLTVLTVLTLSFTLIPKSAISVLNVGIVCVIAGIFSVAAVWPIRGRQ
jgi:hypothetical protein